MRITNKVTVSFNLQLFWALAKLGYRGRHLRDLTASLERKVLDSIERKSPLMEGANAQVCVCVCVCVRVCVCVVCVYVCTLTQHKAYTQVHLHTYVHTSNTCTSPVVHSNSTKHAHRYTH